MVLLCLGGRSLTDPASAVNATEETEQPGASCLRSIRTMRPIWPVVTLLLLTGCQRSAQSPAETREPSEPAPRPVATAGTTPGPVSIDFQNVNFRLGSGIVLEVRHLQGALLGVDADAPPLFDDVRSYVLRIDAGEVAMTPASMTALLNNRTFNYDDAPITDINVSIEDGHLKQTGTLHKGIPVPFTIVADPAVTKQGRIRLRPVSVKAAAVPVAKFMKLFRLELDDLVSSNPSRGFEARDNDFILIPDRLLPDPKVTGRLTGVRIEGNRIVQTFGLSRPAHATGETKNYMHYKGNVLRFGRFTMTNTDLRLIDADPADPFEFSPGDYVRQLVAGYSKNAPDGSLTVYMPDFDNASRVALHPAIRK